MVLTDIIKNYVAWKSESDKSLVLNGLLLWGHV